LRQHFLVLFLLSIPSHLYSLRWAVAMALLGVVMGGQKRG
jgi:hypothetical protein